jgi:divalent metal cation (Fe/Co/Zn/Cd) transporter
VSVETARDEALRTGVRLEVLTVAWMVVEAAVAIGAGIAARSVLLTAFGLDSAIELVSGITLLWRLRAEARATDPERVEKVERRALGASAVLLGLLFLYVLVSATLRLILRIGPEHSWLGLAVSLAALVAMPVLAWRKQVANRTIGSAALRADIAESATCAYLAAATLVGVALGMVTGWWWIEYAAATVVLFFVGREAWEAFSELRSGEDRDED